MAVVFNNSSRRGPATAKSRANSGENPLIGWDPDKLVLDSVQAALQAVVVPLAGDGVNVAAVDANFQAPDGDDARIDDERGVLARS